MPRKKTTKPADRVVYAVENGGKSTTVEASSTKELKAQLSRVLPNLEPYSVQAAAHLAHVERAQVEGSGWSVRRRGVLTFVPDANIEDTPPKAPKQKKTLPMSSSQAKGGPSAVSLEPERAAPPGEDQLTTVGN